MSDLANTIQLSVPLKKTYRQVDGSEREELTREVTIRRPVAGDLRCMDAEPGDIGKTLALAAKLTGLDRRQVDALDIADFGKIAEVVGGFMPAGLATGSTG